TRPNNNSSVGDLLVHQRWLRNVVVGKDLLQGLHLRKVVEDNIGLVRVQRQIVLVIVFRRIERVELVDLGRDRLFVDLRRIELGDVGLCHLFLLVIGGKDCRAILRADIGALAVELGRVVHDGEEDLQNLAVGNLLRVVFDLDRFGVTGPAARHQIVVGGLLAAAGVAGDGVDYAGGVLEHALHAPEAAAGEHGGLDAVSVLGIDGRGGDDHGLFGG